MRFNFIKTGKDLKNYSTIYPYIHANYYAETLQASRYWLKEELLQSLDDITHEKLQNFIKNEYFSQVLIESLMIGNLTAQGC